ncbi:MAG: hypothetical protein JWO40_711 [Candidatus Doudnabacteria bacterium]|nr:hypothetical protein [Candidatus Doudnabacteria bacterium]
MPEEIKSEKLDLSKTEKEVSLKPRLDRSEKLEVPAPEPVKHYSIEEPSNVPIFSADGRLIEKEVPLQGSEIHISADTTSKSDTIQLIEKVIGDGEDPAAESEIFNKDPHDLVNDMLKFVGKNSDEENK